MVCGVWCGLAAGCLLAGCVVTASQPVSIIDHHHKYSTITPDPRPAERASRVQPPFDELMSSSPCVTFEGSKGANRFFATVILQLVLLQ